jgi:RimJ/RimL family protein N-acetyltransferase
VSLRIELSDEGLWFRPIQASDLRMTYEWRMKPRVREMLGDSSEFSFETHEAWFRQYESRVDQECVWIFGNAGGPVGQVSLYRRHDPPMAVTFGRLVVGVDTMLGCGYGTRATLALTRWAFKQGFARVQLDVKPSNAAARALYQRAGYKETISGIEGSDHVHMAAVPPGAITHSVIVGSYNRPRYIAQTLKSIVEQTGPNWEMIVSDDASNDETIQVIRSFTDRDPRCLLLHAPDRPAPGLRADGNVRAVKRINDALRLVTNDIVHYIPDDDFFAPNRFINFESAFVNPSVMMAYGRLHYVDGAGNVGGLLYPGGQVMDPLCQLDQSQVAHRRSCLDKVPEWPSDPDVIGYVVDGLFYRSLVQAGFGPIWPVNALVTYKRNHTFNMQHTAHLSGEQRE